MQLCNALNRKCRLKQNANAFTYLESQQALIDSPYPVVDKQPYLVGRAAELPADKRLVRPEHPVADKRRCQELVADTQWSPEELQRLLAERPEISKKECVFIEDRFYTREGSEVRPLFDSAKSVFTTNIGEENIKMNRKFRIH